MAIVTSAGQPTLVTGLFHDRTGAERAYQLITERGYTMRDVDLVMSDETRVRHFSDDSCPDIAPEAVRAAGDGTIGAIAAAIATMGTSVVIPGLGLVIAGPVANTLAGAGAGGVTGGVGDALIAAGIPEERVPRYEQGIKNGRILLGVQPRNDEDARHFERAWRDSGEYVCR